PYATGNRGPAAWEPFMLTPLPFASSRLRTTVGALLAAAALHAGLASAQATRTEHDLLGPKEVPADAYYGVQTARALENFQLSGVAINHYPGFVEAWAIVKLAAA